MFYQFSCVWMVESVNAVHDKFIDGTLNSFSAFATEPDRLAYSSTISFFAALNTLLRPW